jgi:hypothetical protein
MPFHGAKDPAKDIKREAKARGIGAVAPVQEGLPAAFPVDVSATSLFRGEDELPDLVFRRDAFFELNSTIDIGRLSPVKKVKFRTPAMRVSGHFEEHCSFEPEAKVDRALEY